MAMQIDYRDARWLIEGYSVSWSEDIGGGRAGWQCECWKDRPPDLGARPHCRHTDYVELCELDRRPVEESGARVVSLKR